MHYVLVETGEAGSDDRLETCFGDDKLGAIRACNRIVNGLAANGWVRDEVVFAGSSYTWRKPGEQARTVRVAEYAYCDHGIHEAENEEAEVEARAAFCPKAPSGGHDAVLAPDLNIDIDSEMITVDVVCHYCGRPGSVAAEVSNVLWEERNDPHAETTCAACDGVPGVDHASDAHAAAPTLAQLVEARVGPPMVYGTVEQGKTDPQGAAPTRWDWRYELGKEFAIEAERPDGTRIPVQGYEQESI